MAKKNASKPESSKGEIQIKKSPLERALKISNDEALAKAIQDALKRDDIKMN